MKKNNTTALKWAERTAKQIWRKAEANMNRIFRVTLVKQHDEKDCGVACMSMILGYYGRKLPFSHLRESIKVDQHGANLFGLIDCAEKNGLNAQAFECTSGDLYAAVENEPIPFPLVARILNRGIYEHFVVVTAIVGNKVYVSDPDAGRRVMTKEAFAKCFLGQIVTFTPGEDFRKENLRKGSINRFLHLITCQKKLIATVSLLSALITGIGLIGSFVFQFLIDDVLSDIDDVCCIEEGLEMFAGVILGVGILYLFKLAFELLRGKLLTKMSRNIDIPLMLNSYNHTAGLPMSFFDTHKTGEIITRLTDSAKIRDALSSAALTLMIDSVMAIAGGFMLYRISHDLFHIALTIFLIYSFISLLYIKPLDKLNNDLMSQGAEFQSYLKETVDGMETVKLTGSENQIKKKMSDLFRRFIDRNMKGSMLSISKETLIAFITSVGTLALLWAGAIQIIVGELTTGKLIVFYSLMGYFFTPVQNLINLQSGVQSAIVAGKRLNDIMDLPEEEIAPDDGSSKAVSSISFDNVSFRYGNRQLVLNDVSFRAERGQHIALVGNSGCGKSTVTKLLMGMYEPEEGCVTVNGAPLAKHSLAWLRKHVSVVSQETFLFADTVRSNLLFGMPEDERPDDKELVRLLELCGCQFIKELPFGLDTVLEENGSNLSGGQRQRLAIVRALIRKPDVLIMDEATSNLDAVSEHEILNAIEKECPDAIIIAAAHRLSTIARFDTILVLENGSIIEQGVHDQLLTSDKLYAKMWRLQNSVAA